MKAKPDVDIIMIGHFAKDRLVVDGRGEVASGGGDTCFAAYLGWRLRASPAEAVRVAAAVTTLKQEQAGPWRGSLADVERLSKSQVK